MTASDKDRLAEHFEQHRKRLNALASRIVGSHAEAEEAVQDAWIRLSRADPKQIENLGSWLTTVVSRLCLNVLQSRRAGSAVPLDLVESLDQLPDLHEETDPEQQALLAESVGVALLLVLDQLTPGERVAFVLHDMFDLPFDDIATILGKSATAARQIASRARRRVRQADAPFHRDERHRRLVSAFLDASRKGNFEALLSYLDPSVVIRVNKTGTADIRGSNDVARLFVGRLGGVQPALVNGVMGAVWAPGGEPKTVFNFKAIDDKIIEVELISDPEQLRTLSLELYLVPPRNLE